MKINFTNVFLYKKEKILEIIMRVILFLCFTTAFGIAPTTTFSQNAKIKIDSDTTISVGEMFELIQEQAGYKFVYSDGLIVDAPKVKLKRGVISAKLLLKRGLAPIGCTYEFTKNETVIVKRKDGAEVGAVQEQISGTVVDAAGVPVAGANIIVKGTSRGAQSDFDGIFSIRASKGEVLVVSFLGLKTQEITVGDSDTINVKMEEDTSELDEVVITALGIKKERRELGYAQQTVKGAELANRQETNVFDALKGRVAGVQIRNSDSGVGGTTTIVIRGGNNLSKDRSDQPLIILDGVPIQNDDTNLDGGNGRDWGSGINSVNPEDIESMEVLKGANAAALYGSRAANGVILITTKKGRSSEGVGITYSNSFAFTEAVGFRDVQNVYGIGYNGWNKETPFATNANGNLVPQSVSFWGSGASWGPEMDGTIVEWYDGELRPYDPQPNNIKEPWVTGERQMHNVSFQGANEKGSFRFSLSDLTSTPIQRNSGYDRLNASVNASLNLTDKLTAQFVLNYTEEDQLNPISTGDDDNAFGKALLYNWARSEKVQFRLDNYKNPDGTRAFRGGRGGDLLWNMLEAKRRRESNRYIGSLTINWALTDWLSLMVRSGIDNISEHRTFNRAPWDIDRLRYEYNSGLYRDQIKNNDLLFTINKNITEDLTFTSNIGASDFHEDRYSLWTRNYRDWQNPDLPAVNNARGNGQNPHEGFREKKTRSLLGTLNFAYKNYLFLEVTGRNDWSSTLPKGSNSYFYPSVSGAFVFTDVMGDTTPSWLSSGKVRASWTKASTDDNPFQLLPTYGIGDWFGNPRANVKSTIPPKDLKPQETYAYEAGIDLGLFNEKAYFTFNYYDKRSENQILSGPIARSSGFANKKFNSGSISNSGIELQVNAFPIVTQDFKWEVILNYSKNWNKVNNLDDEGGVTEYSLGGMWGGNGPAIIAKKGEPYGTIMGWDFIYDSETGKKLIDSDGIPYTTNTRVPLGNITPKWIGGMVNTLTYKNFSFNAVIDAKIGGDMWFGTKGVGDSFGQSPASLFGRDTQYGGLNWTDGNGNDRTDGTIIDGVVSVDTPVFDDATGTYSYTTSGENTTVIPARWYWAVQSSNWGAGNPTTNAVHENSFIRLTELQLSYNLPKKVLSKVFLQNVSVSVFARNVGYIYKTAPDNINPLGGINPGKIDGREFGSSPITRTIGLSTRVSF